MDYQKELKDFKPEHEYFIGIDSDGCIFDSMEVKQKEFFIPNALKFFDLYAISGTLRETWEFVNLYSMHRGGNRFISMIKVFDLLNRRDEVKNSGCLVPDMTSLTAWVKVETKLGNDSLREYLRSHYDKDLERVLRWSEAVNDDIARHLHNIPSFPHAIDALKKITSYADLVIVSQTPLEALNREWEEHDLKKYVKIIAGQEHGTKAEHINLSAKGKYHDKKILMIGDAKGDLDSARKNGILFYPIIPGEEDKSWERFLNEGVQKFTSGTYSGKYQEKLLEEFNKSLPATPPWQ